MSNWKVGDFGYHVRTEKGEVLCECGTVTRVLDKKMIRVDLQRKDGSIVNNGVDPSAFRRTKSEALAAFIKLTNWRMKWDMEAHRKHIETVTGLVADAERQLRATDLAGAGTSPGADLGLTAGSAEGVSESQEPWKVGDFGYLANGYGSVPGRAGVEVVRVMVIQVSPTTKADWISLEGRQYGQVFRVAVPQGHCHRTQEGALKALVEKSEKQMADFPSTARLNTAWIHKAQQQIDRLKNRQETPNDG